MEMNSKPNNSRIEPAQIEPNSSFKASIELETTSARPDPSRKTPTQALVKRLAKPNLTVRNPNTTIIEASQTLIPS